MQFFCRDCMPKERVYPTNPKHPRRGVLAPPSFFWHIWNQARKGLSNWLYTYSEVSFEPARFFRVVPASRTEIPIEHCFYFKEGQGRAWKLQACQLQLRVKLQRRLFCEILKTHKWQCSHWSQPSRLHEGKILLIKPDLSLWQGSTPSWPRNASWSNLGFQ